MEKENGSRAKQGLRMAIGDVVEMTSNLPVHKIKQIDEELVASGVVSLSYIRERYWKRFAKILERGKITSEEHYYLLKNMVPLLEDAERKKRVEVMILNFEESDRQGKQQ